MAAFERVRSGMEGLDGALDSIRLGDNVVWQVSSVDEYRRVAIPFARQALADGRRLVYVRFAAHPPILAEDPRVETHELDPALGFESFTGEVHRVIAEAGREAFYVFDCLSGLQTAWSADLMMGNFFVVTCPYLFELDTVAFFCLLRREHSYATVARIRETTQILIDLHTDAETLYAHPLKVWKRYSPTMFLPHWLEPESGGQAEPLTDGVAVSRFYQAIGVEAGDGGERNLDSWERFFIEARERFERGQNGNGPSDALAREIAERLIGIEPRLLSLTTKTLSIRDLLGVKDRLIGSGKIGGKAAGLLIARSIVARRLPEIAPRTEPHDSFFIGSDVFYTYLVHNRLWKQRIIQRTDDGYFTEAAALGEGIRRGAFPDEARERFVRLLEYFGQTPIIVRSSSLLEDSFGHAFAGKYESVFCVNAGSPEDRLAAFEDAVKRVYASTMDPSALAYRRQRGLHRQDEQMAVLVQRVSGSLRGSLFFPAIAGVGYSFNAWRWHRDIDPSAGMLRLVIGLGTRAVDRTGSDYPRLMSLDKPDLAPSAADGAAHYCQRSVDVLDLASGALATRELDEIVPALPPDLAARLVERDREAEARLEESGKSRPVYLGTCSGVAREKALLGDLGAAMRVLQEEYDNPVDVEFTVNWGSGGDYLVNLLQCRPLQTPRLEAGEDFRVDATAAAIGRDRLLFFLAGDSMGPQMHTPIDAVIIVDPRLYYELPWRDKPTVARAIGELNAWCRDRELAAVLAVPGRIGTSSPELGVPVSFAEIGSMRVIVERAYSAAGYQPELSFGSHFFQDLVEAGIYYGAASERESQAIFNEAALRDEPDIAGDLLPSFSLPPRLLRVYAPKGLEFASDVRSGSCVCGFLKR